MTYRVGAVSLGCNKNRVDTESALGVLRDHGYRITSHPEEADILLVNTCGFISSAKEESINTILDMAEYKKTGRCRLLVVTGCLAQRYEQELLKELPEIDLLLGVNQYAHLAEMIDQAMPGHQISSCQDDYGYFEQKRVLTTPFYSAYIRIGEGCSNRCAFCAIPLIRGPYRSREESAILHEIRALAADGVREHILVAQDTTRYGSDRKEDRALIRLMQKAAEIDGVSWLRVLYCYPDKTSEELLDLLADHPKICPYLDLPVQHISPEILRRMRRRSTKEDILRCVKGAKDRNLTLRTSIIVGFPGETEDQFRELMDFVEEAEFDRLGTFQFSPEENTPAADMPDQIPDEIKQERYDRLMSLQQRISLKNNRRRIHTEETVLITDVHQKDFTALARSRREVPEEDGEILLHYRDHAPEIGSFVKAKITDAGPYDLIGELL